MSDVDLLEHKAGPHPEEPGPRNCVRCGEFWPCPARMEQVRALAEEIAADRRERHNPQRMLDIAEVTPGCWVGYRGTENLDRPELAAGGIVITIDHIADQITGESLRVFHVAQDFRGQIRWHRLTQDEVGPIEPPDPRMITYLRRSMCRAVGKKTAAVLTDERRMAEAIGVLIRSIA